MAKNDNIQKIFTHSFMEFIKTKNISNIKDLLTVSVNKPPPIKASHKVVSDTCGKPLGTQNVDVKNIQTRVYSIVSSF